MLKVLDGERAKLVAEVGEYQERVQRDEMKEEEARRDIFSLKQKVITTRQ